MNRDPAVAGTFYPADAALLASDVDELIAKAGKPEHKEAPKAIIAPHAGYVYSGPIAASAYKELSADSGISRVVLLGPSHRVAFKGIAACTASHYVTPLGAIPIDQPSVKTIQSLPNVGVLDQAHRDEHSLEVHLPFLQRQLGEFSLVPLVVGDATPDEVASVLQALWAGPETLVVISTDLSHYLPYESAQEKDRSTAHSITSLDASLSPEQACGCRPVNGLLTFAQQKGLKIRQIEVANSGDTAGDRSRVVGYGAFIIHGPSVCAPTAILKKSYQQRLLQVAREAVLSPLTGQKNYNIDLARFPAQLQEQGASFVTLNRDGALRGCIGSLSAPRQLVLDVAHNAQAAAFRDSRFTPITLQEFNEVDIHISVLSAATPLPVANRADLINKLVPGRDGLIIAEQGRRATYLPSVWQQLPEPEQFVSELRKKAGLSPASWTSQTQVWTYTTFEFS